MKCGFCGGRMVVETDHLPGLGWVDELKCANCGRTQTTPEQAEALRQELEAADWAAPVDRRGDPSITGPRRRRPLGPRRMGVAL